MSADKIFKYGELEVTLNPTDYVLQESLEAAIGRMIDTVNNLDSAAKNSARLKSMVEAVNQVFDDVFGDGSALKALGGSTDLEDAMDALNALTKHMQAGAERVNNKYGQFRPSRRKG